MKKGQTYTEPTLLNCDDEKIHLIGSIQDHAYLLAVDQEFIVRYASSNLGGIIGEDKPLGKSLNDISFPVSKADLEHLLNGLSKVKPEKPERVLSFKKNDEVFTVIAHKSGQHSVLEIEPVSTDATRIKDQEQLNEIMLSLHQMPEDINTLMQSASEKVRDLTGHDRVMIYKFWDDWHGEVIAESKSEELEPFLGLHYPATDIPRQARALYIRNLTRIISDVHSDPVPIESQTPEPLDLSFSQTRSVSPMHIQYLKNIGVGASYSISIVCEGKLWGLIACHHNSEKFLTFEQRRATEMIGQYLSNVIKLTRQRRARENQDKLLSKIASFDEVLYQDWDIISALTNEENSFIKLVECDGGAIMLGEEIHTLGATPSEAQIKTIADYLKNSNNREKVFAERNISKLIPEAVDFDNHISGMMVGTIAKSLNEYIFWFKKEHKEKITWGGKKEEYEEVDADGNVQLTPRRSFEKWVENVVNTSESWKSGDFTAASILRTKVHSAMKVKANELRKLNEKLGTTQDDLDSMVSTLSHDLKTPVATIAGYLELLVESDESLQDNLFIKKIEQNCDLLKDMIANVLSLADMSRKEIEKSPVNISEILSEIKSQMKVGRSFSNLTIHVPEGCTVRGNKTMLYQLFLNLVENGFKYRSKEREPEVTVSVEENDHEMIFKVQDNGIGIDAQFGEKIFKMFSRVHNDTNVEGSGIGLAIVKKIVQKHNAEIWLDSVVDQGSAFHIAFKK